MSYRSLLYSIAVVNFRGSTTISFLQCSCSTIFFHWTANSDQIGNGGPLCIAHGQQLTFESTERIWPISVVGLTRPIDSIDNRIQLLWHALTNTHIWVMHALSTFSISHSKTNVMWSCARSNADSIIAIAFCRTMPNYYLIILSLVVIDDLFLSLCVCVCMLPLCHLNRAHRPATESVHL